MAELDDVETTMQDGTRHGTQLEALYSISRALAAGKRQRATLSAVLDILHSELGMPRATVTLLSPDGKNLVADLGHDLSERRRLTVRYQLGEGIVGRVVQSGERAIVPKISSEPLFLDRLHKRRKTIDQEISFICVPIVLDTEVVGALSADRPYEPSHPLDDDARLLSIVAGMIANDVKARRTAAAERQALEEENLRLRHELADRFRPENIIGNSGAMREVYRAIHQVSGSDSTVLVRGETGTGKELVARAIHYSSPRAKGPFVKVNCAALSENLFESEMFGHEKGAFTGAIRARQGRIEEAAGGTLFLDEIGDFPPTTQVKLLLVLQEKTYERVGANRSRKANVRVVCATHRNLEQMVEAGTFRKDLYYRINVFPVFLPPLRERKDDILLLADHFVEQHALRLGKDIRRISTPAINMMFAYHWPGNVRELENCIERASLLSTDGVVHGHHLPPTLQTSEASETIGEGTLGERVDVFERDIIVDALKRAGGNMAEAARDLGATSRVLRYKVRHLGIDWRMYRRK